jgi:FkbM family methyltransferase
MEKLRSSSLTHVLRRLLKNQVYTARSGLIVGLKRRGGLGFVPGKALSREEIFLKNLDFKGKVVYDVGGFIGLMTMFFARAVGKTGRVITFEPNPQNYRAIVDHIELNRFINVSVIQMGLSSKPETLKFLVGKDSAQGTADPNLQKRLLARGTVKVLEIEVDTLDNQIAVNNLPRPDFVKIDVEGLEIDVLQGLVKTISNCRPKLHIELHGIREQEVVELLLAYNYNIYQIEAGINLTQQNIDRVRGHLYAS